MAGNPAAGPAVESRSGAFKSGSNTNLTTGPHAFRNNSVDGPVMMSPNGMSSGDAKLQTPTGALPNPNDGNSASTYAKEFPGNYGTNLQI